MNDSATSEGDHQPLLDVLAILRILWRRRIIIFASTGAFILAAGLYVIVTKPAYVATAVILVDPREPRTTDTDNVLAGIGSDSAAIASQVAVIGSRDLLTRVFEAEGLVADSEFADPGLLASLLPFGSPPTRSMIFERFSENVSVEREGLTYVIDVGFKSQDPEKAARIVNAIVNHYISSRIAEKSGANADVSGLLQSRIAGLQRDVLEAEQAVESFRVANRLFDSGTVQTRIDQLNAQLLAAKEAARQAETRHRQALAAGTTPRGLISLTEILSSPSAENLRDDYNQRSVALANAQSTLGGRHPTVVKLSAELAQLEGLMVREVARITEELGAASDIADQIVVEINSDLATLRAEANQSNRKAVELRQLERNADASRQVLEQFQKRSEETSQFESLQFSDARIIAVATAPLRPTWPKPSLLLSVGAVLGLLAGSAIALLVGAPAAATHTRARRPIVNRNEPTAPRRPSGPLAVGAQHGAATTSMRVTDAVPQLVSATPSAAAATAAEAIVPPGSPFDAAPAQSPAGSSLRGTDDVQRAIAELRRMKSYAELT